MEIRYSKPTRYDTAPYGAMCIVEGGDGHKDQIYIQTSEDVDTASWVYMGDFLMIALRDKLDNAHFIKDCLKSYTSK